MNAEQEQAVEEAAIHARLSLNKQTIETCLQGFQAIDREGILHPC